MPLRLVMAPLLNKKAPAASPAGHDYRQPKVDEGADAF
jgi:hypothetical protein